MSDAVPTIELFPGVQFRRRTTPHAGTNQCWEFFADNQLRPDGKLDHRTFSGSREGKWLPAYHAYADDILLDHVADIIRQRDAALQNAARYLAMRDCEWPGSCQQVGIVSRDNEAYWLHGEEADRAVDATMAPPPQAIVFAPAPIAISVAPVAEADRECHEKACYECDGSGRSLITGMICKTNAQLPF